MPEVILIDPKTIFLLYFWGNFFTCILIFSYSFSYATIDNRKTLKWFGLGKLLLTIAWVLIILRNIIDDFLSINLANSMVFCACCYETAAMLSLLKTNTKKRFRLQLAITLAAIIIFNIGTFLGCTINTRVLIGAIGIFAIYLPPTIHYFTEKRKKNFFRTFYVLCYVLFEILIMVRAIYRYIYPQNLFFSHNTLDSLYSISLFLVALVGIIGFLLLVKEKQDHKIQKLLDDKNQFFSIISHDLRGPVGASASLSELLAEDIEKYSREEIREISEMLYQSNKNSYKLLENLLEWSRVQTGMITLSPKKIILNTLIEENIELNKNAALNKNIYLLFEPDDVFEVEADKHMIDTVLRNLLNNAIKFTNKNGKVEIKLIKKDRKVEIAVIDNGIGIPDEIKDKLFKINRKVIQRGTENEAGSGLGLLLCSEFISMHKGKIWVESHKGKGSSFKFTLPVKQ
ncbi:sensor histidine kinase [Flavobacterium hibisci]|uniref:sensor histidine kinase n=1 Tax=Flavobacterium hibisci TaxID=1914462 RepID=UPI001CC1ADDD|nr:HAMP domain-containing sensor histidine kinase [Flavobacterium hibisci]MBZ4041062.1 HAMP domain-containing histidine kinase [Flavobacterium hibisci]